MFGAHRVGMGSEAVMSCLSEITNLPLSKPIEIEQIGFAWQGIGSSNFHIADFGFGQLLRFSLLHSNFAECTFTVPTQFESRLYSIFFRAGSIFNWNYILYTSFLYILSKAQQRILLLYMYNMIYKYNDLEILRLNSIFFNQIMFY